jgi:hypothetical protein
MGRLLAHSAHSDLTPCPDDAQNLQKTKVFFKFKFEVPRANSAAQALIRIYVGDKWAIWALRDITTRIKEKLEHSLSKKWPR